MTISMIKNVTTFGQMYKRAIGKIQIIPWWLLFIPTAIFAAMFFVGVSIGGDLKNITNIFNAYLISLLALSFFFGISATSGEDGRRKYFTICKFVLATYAMIFWCASMSEMATLLQLAQLFLALQYLAFVFFFLGFGISYVTFENEKVPVVWNWKNRLLFSGLMVSGFTSILFSVCFPDTVQVFVNSGINNIYGITQ